VKKRPTTEPSQKRQNKTKAKKGKHLKIQLRRGEKTKKKITYKGQCSVLN
jgi:hypothetical protein